MAKKLCQHCEKINNKLESQDSNGGHFRTRVGAKAPTADRYFDVPSRVCPALFFSETKLEPRRVTKEGSAHSTVFGSQRAEAPTAVAQPG